MLEYAAYFMLPSKWFDEQEPFRFHTVRARTETAPGGVGSKIGISFVSIPRPVLIQFQFVIGSKAHCWHDIDLVWISQTNSNNC